MKENRNEQEAFWRGQFGSEYIKRNQSNSLIKNNLYFFSHTLAKAHKIQSIIEYGANIGLNLCALRLLMPHLSFCAVEINHEAVTELKKFPWIESHHQSIIDFVPHQQYDLVLVKGVLIHVHPNDLPYVYEKMYQSSNRYILMAEYYNPTPIMIQYRGHSNKLFKRDFCGEFLNQYSDFHLVDYGFLYHRDHNFPQDDTTWFLLEKD